MAVFEMTGGIVFTYRGSWCAEGQNTSWECAWRATGVCGTVSWDGFKTVTGEAAEGDEGFIRPCGQLPLPSPQALPHSGHAGVIREFLDCLESSSRPQTDCRDNIKSVAMVLGAIESAECGRRVTIRL